MRRIRKARAIIIDHVINAEKVCRRRSTGIDLGDVKHSKVAGSPTVFGLSGSAFHDSDAASVRRAELGEEKDIDLRSSQKIEANRLHKRGQIMRCLQPIAELTCTRVYADISFHFKPR